MSLVLQARSPRLSISRTGMVVVVGKGLVISDVIYEGPLIDYGEYHLLWLISSSTNLTMMRMIARHARGLKLLIGLCLCESPTTIGGTSELWRCSQLLFSIINSKLKIVFFFKPLLAARSTADLPRQYMWWMENKSFVKIVELKLRDSA